MAGAAAGLGEDAGNQLAIEGQGLRRQDFGGHQDDRLSRRQEMPAVLQGQLGQDAADHVAQVGHAFLQIGIGDLLEELAVFFEDGLQGGGGVDLVGQDGGLDLADQRRIAQELAMGAENGRLVLADLVGHAIDDGVETARMAAARRCQNG